MIYVIKPKEVKTISIEELLDIYDKNIDMNNLDNYEDLNINILRENIHPFANFIDVGKNKYKMNDIYIFIRIVHFILT